MRWGEGGHTHGLMEGCSVTRKESVCGCTGYEGNGSHTHGGLQCYTEGECAWVGREGTVVTHIEGCRVTQKVRWGNGSHTHGGL